MHGDFFNGTTIGADYLKTGQTYPTDALLDYLSGLMKMRQENEADSHWKGKYENEIEAVKEILRRQALSEEVTAKNYIR